MTSGIWVKWMELRRDCSHIPVNLIDAQFNTSETHVVDCLSGFRVAKIKKKKI